MTREDGSKRTGSKVSIDDFERRLEVTAEKLHDSWRHVRTQVNNHKTFVMFCITVMMIVVWSVSTVVGVITYGPIGILIGVLMGWFAYLFLVMVSLFFDSRDRCDCPKCER